MRTMFRPHINLILAGVAVASAAGLIVLLWLNVKPDTLAFELAKAFLQVLVVVVIGALITLGTSDYQKDRDAWRDLKQRSDELLGGLLDDAVNGYHNVKRARRVMRARLGAKEGQGTAGIRLYDDQMEVINDTQLRFERLKLKVDGVSDGRLDAADLRSNIETIKDALHELVQEYESERRRLSVDVDRTFTARLPKLTWFLSENSRDFNKKIGDPFEAILKQIQAAMLKSLRQT